MTTRFVSGRPNLVWLEDRDSTAKIELGEAKRLGCHVLVRALPGEILALIEEEFGAEYVPQQFDDLRIAFVIDVMIAGLFDLTALGVEHSDTHGGLNGGYVFTDRILRKEDASCRYRPVCFLSERQLTPDLEEDLQYLRDRKDPDGKLHGPVEYIRKRSSSELERFKKFLGTL